MGSRVAVVAALACVALLAGCATTPSPDPMSDQLRSAIRQDRISTAWSPVQAEYPEALQSAIRVGPVLDDAAWEKATVACFADHGFVVVRKGTRFEYSSSQGETPLQYAVAQYNCTIALPSLGEIVEYLDIYQLGDLYDYFTERVQPCLALHGVAVEPPPDRAEFEAQDGDSQWTPFLAVTRDKLPASRVAELERECPPVPEWMHL